MTKIGMVKKESIKQEESSLTTNFNMYKRKSINEQPRKIKKEKKTSSQPSASGAQQVRWARSITPSERVLRNSELVGLICHFVSFSEGEASNLRRAEGSFRRVPLVSRGWTTIFVPLLRVNKVFWSTASGILWRCMEGVEPFLRILQPSKWRYNTIPGALTFHDKTTSWQWERFKVHSLKTQTLIFSGACPRVVPAWIAFLEAAKPPEITWFPMVKHIFLLSNESLPVFLTISMAHQLERLHIGGDAASSAELEPILSSFALKPLSLKSLHVLQSLSLAALLKVQQIKSLTSLCLTIPKKAKVEHLKHSIGNLKALTILEIRRSSDASSGKPKNRMKYSPLETETGVNDALCRSSALENLRTLIVDADIVVQDLVAAALCPRSLENLNVVVTSPDAAHIAQALTVHLQRNPALTSLSIRVIEDSDVEHVDATCGSGAGVTLDVDTIFEEIGLLRNLRSLHLEGIRLERRSTAAKDFARTVLPNLKSLEDLTFLPRANKEGKKLRLPRLECLMEISKNNEKLAKLDMAFMLAKKAPDVSKKYVSTHGLKTLLIRGTSKRDDIDEGEELGAVIDVARFLDIVFPSLHSVIVAQPKLEEASGFRLWDQIQDLVLMNQEMRVERVEKGDVE